MFASATVKFHQHFLQVLEERRAGEEEGREGTGRREETILNASDDDLICYP